MTKCVHYGWDAVEVPTSCVAGQTTIIQSRVERASLWAGRIARRRHTPNCRRPEIFYQLLDCIQKDEDGLLSNHYTLPQLVGYIAA